MHQEEHIDLKTFKPNDKPNQYLVCPQGYCQHTPDEISPIYSVPVEKLYHAWKQVFASKPRVSLVVDNPNELQVVQVSLIFRFRDYVHIDLIPKGPNASTFAIYSHSRLGHYDFGVNKKRVTDWIASLNKLI